MAEEHRLKFKNSVIHYYKFGHGPRTLFCLHGYGREAKDFLFLEKHIENKYVAYAIDLPFHGETKWKEKLLFTDKDLLQIFELVCGNTNKFSLLGYSMGGRVVLHLLSTCPQRIHNVALLAPDGLHVNFWYALATRTTVGNLLFRKTIAGPGWLFQIVARGGRLNVYNRSILKMVRQYLHTPNQRILLYRRWTTMRRFRPAVNKIKRHSTRYKIPVSILFGASDYVILTKHGDKLKGEPYVTIQTVAAGHQLIREKFAPQIVKLLSTE